MAVPQKTGPVTRRRILFGGAVMVAAGFAIREYRLIPPAYAGGKLSVEQAHDKAARDDIVLIDIRRPDEWARTGIGAGAHPIDMRREDFIAALRSVAGPDTDQPIALICARGVRSANMSLQLSEAGYTNIINVPGGMLGSRNATGWLDADLPVVAFEENNE
ncbi:rhodanese-like domain-containing protein [Ruegeria sp. 2012CJ41-6]|uniref:Rhodanese-like domain-containing protein n=1 Tax=Ruegeria spongiae TaxID=2942209 RepID=A0ABT0Q5A9_9RHOB|nr:rhodanese-like domain-containing protein [Ruegeria spongiae]MCL6284089.1 rhodanese-like domain-containing protein [Ruegeria spongiae]